MIKKKIEANKPVPTRKNTLWIGLSTLLLTLLVVPALTLLGRIVCPKTEYGSCDIGWDIGSAGAIYTIATLLFVYSICMIIAGSITPIVNKYRANLSRNKDNRNILYSGIAALAAAPILLVVVQLIARLLCKKSEYGTCELGFAITSTLTSIVIAFAAAITGLVLMIIWLVLRARAK